MSELHVGREMDAAVAKALGKTIRQWGDELEDNDLVLFGGNIVRCDPTYESLLAWMPSTFIADAFAALDEFRKTHACKFSMESYGPSSWRVVLYVPNTKGRGLIGQEFICDTPAEAICRAILDLEARNGH